MESATLDLTGDDEGASGGSCSEVDEPTQPYRDPDETQLMIDESDTQRPISAIPCCIFLVSYCGYKFDLTGAVKGNREIIWLLRDICLTIEKRKSGPGLNAIIELNYDGICSSRWESVVVNRLLYQSSDDQFINNLTLSYVDLSTVKMELTFETNYLKAVLTNSLVGPITHEVMEFICVPVLPV